MPVQTVNLCVTALPMKGKLSDNGRNAVLCGRPGIFQRSPEGEILLLQYLHDKIGGYDLNVFATPVRAEDGSIRNVLFAASRTKDVADKLLMEIYDGKGFSSIWDEEGNIVLNSNSETASRAVHISSS